MKARLLIFNGLMRQLEVLEFLKTPSTPEKSFNEAA